MECGRPFAGGQCTLLSQPIFFTTSAQMKTFLFLACFSLAPFSLFAQPKPTPSPAAALPKKVTTTWEFRKLLLATKWSWRNVSANVPDRECVFMDDGTFRHPNFIARYTIRDVGTVELVNKHGKIAVMKFDPAFATFEALDFGGARRITGKRL